MNRNRQIITQMDRYVFVFCLFSAPIGAIFIWAEVSNWPAWVQAVGSIEAIIASSMIATSTHRRTIKAQREKEVTDHTRVFTNLKSLIEKTYSYLVYIRDHAVGGLDKEKSASIFPRNLGSSDKHWSTYGFKAADIRRSMSLFEKHLEQLSTLSIAEVGDAVIASEIASFISHCKTLIEEINVGWDVPELSSDSSKKDEETHSSDSFNYRPGTPNLSPSQKRIGLSHAIARGYMTYYFSSDLPAVITKLHERLTNELNAKISNKDLPNY